MFDESDGAFFNDERDYYLRNNHCEVLVSCSDSLIINMDRTFMDDTMAQEKPPDVKYFGPVRL